MAVRTIMVLPHIALTRKAELVTNIDERVVSLAEDMAETMYRAPGIGLAANQLGELLRLIVVDVIYPYEESRDRKKNPIIILNPEIIKKEGKTVNEEGCLSVPELGVEIERAEFIQVQGVDISGKPLRFDAEGLFARALQHEIDHLNGTTILDHASPLRRDLYRRRLKKKARRDK